MTAPATTRTAREAAVMGIAHSCDRGVEENPMQPQSCVKSPGSTAREAFCAASPKLADKKIKTRNLIKTRLSNPVIGPAP
jgi:hypothetical protein